MFREHSRVTKMNDTMKHSVHVSFVTFKDVTFKNWALWTSKEHSGIMLSQHSQNFVVVVVVSWEFHELSDETNLCIAGLSLDWIVRCELCEVYGIHRKD